MSTVLLPLPKTFRSRPTGRYFFSTILILIGSICPLIIIGVLLRPVINTSLPINSIPLPLLLGSIGLIIVLLLLSGFFLRAYCLIRVSKIILRQDGILYNAVSFKMYIPWKNVVSLGSVHYGIPFRGLALREPAVMDSKVREGMQQGIAVIELTRFIIGKAHFKQKCPFRLVLPLDAGLVGINWEQGEFGAYLRQYAPQIFKSEPQK